MEDEYEPVLGRPNVAWYNLIGDFLNILKAFIGTNYQALPFAFHNSGLVLGIVGLFVIASLTDHCIQLLVKCKYRVIDLACHEEREKGTSEHDIIMMRKRLESTVSYGDVAKNAFGNWCYVLTQFLVWFTQYATCVSYFIFIGNTIIEVYPLVMTEVNIRNGTPVNGTSYSFSDCHSVVGEGVPMLSLDHIIHKRSIDNLVEHLYQKDLQKDIYDFPNSTFPTDTNSSLYLNLSTVTVTPTVPPTFTTASYRNITSTTSKASNVTTQISPTEPLTVSPDVINYDNTAPDLRLVMLFPLPFFIITSLLRKLRYLSPLSSIASLALFIGAVCVVIFISYDFQLATAFSLFKIKTLPLFLGQITSAYEGIGCLIPIHSSMEGNRHLFPLFLHSNVYIVFSILCTFGSLGYLRYGEDVKQIIVENIRQHSLKSTFVDLTLVISVLFTYPLQCFPVIEITETYIFGTGRICGPPLEPQLVSTEDNPATIQDDDRGLLPSSTDVEFHASQVSVVVPRTVPAYRRNILRVILTLSIVGIALLMRNSYAYLNVFSGAVGCSALSYILPCMIHLKLCNPSRLVKFKDIAIITFAVVVSIMAVVQVLYYLVTGQAESG